MKFKPKKTLLLASALLFSDNSGTVELTVRCDASCTHTYTKNVVKGPNPILFVDDFSLVGGKTYALSVSTKASGVSPNPPKLENLNRCSPSVNPSKELDIEYNGNVVLMDIKYKF